MSLSDKRNSPVILQPGEFFACQSKVFLLYSYERCPTEEFFRLDLSEKLIFIFGEDDPCFPSSDSVAHAFVNSWAHFSILRKRLVLPVDFLVLSRVDLWDLNKSKRDTGRIRKPIIQSLTPKILQGTNVIITTMGRDLGLMESVDESIKL